MREGVERRGVRGVAALVAGGEGGAVGGRVVRGDGGGWVPTVHVGFVLRHWLRLRGGEVSGWERRRVIAAG